MATTLLMRGGEEPRWMNSSEAPSWADRYFTEKHDELVLGQSVSVHHLFLGRGEVPQSSRLSELLVEHCCRLIVHVFDDASAAVRQLGAL